MTEVDYGRLIYLVLLGMVVAGYFFAQNRRDLPKVVQQGAIWALIFVGVIAGYGMWGDIRQTVAPRQMVQADAGLIEVPRQPDGHFYLTVEVNGTPVDFVVDTGASDVVLSRADAARVGLDPDALAYTGRALTANGTVQTAPVRLDSLRLGPYEDTRVRASVNGGEMDGSLLGMSYLERFARIEISGGRLVLTR